ncbi:LOW QUALITY PROTEIN: putative 1-phosphatidylinositol-3-phosphate 5-kinase FAB1C [Dioscorea cayenensis subsp. rotundata]|uniref:1-phosphatidylinositol-3-phosphate 5-kinase n=1 Tax=Dioscorea cayennensis subsp. rotundata TaxID=55577 RepID=A0AB40CZS8_DIOCR|nr:LOW QUALITY PROTEIN: putative 1-phosphatidylinositol-3-phosphate 5-kinase FAB1C [Dioscorea cayenensis subsp. rotundata]
MGIGESSVLDLVVRRVRSWIGRFAGALVMDSLPSCSECSLGLGPGAKGFSCRCCGRLFCRKCMQSGGVDQQPKYCAFCFQSVGNMETAVVRPVCPQTVPECPQLRFKNSRFAQLMEQQQQQQQQQGRSLHSCCSSCRSDEDEDAEENGKHFSSPMSDFSQDVSSDVDASSVNLGYENCSFKSVASSPFDSPGRLGDPGDYSPVKNSVSGHDTSAHLRKPGVESDDRCSYGNLSVYKSDEGQKDQQPLDFENNGRIWYPPEPEEEYGDAENGYFEYDDEDDDVGESGKLFSSSDFDTDAFKMKERANGSNKEALTSAVHGHFTALVSQLLKAEGIHFDSESGGLGWLGIVSSLAWLAAHFVKPDTSNGGSMDPGNYVKVKCLASGSPSDSCFIKGVVCTKNISHKRMISQHKNPRILILGGSLEYQKVQHKLASINAVLEQEINHLKIAVAKIEAHRPNILLVEKSVSSYAQEYLLKKEISLVLNVKRPLLERISRCTGAEIVPSIDDIASARLGQCEIFRIAKVFEHCPQGEPLNKRSMKTWMFFEGCPRRLGCTVLLKGASQDELKRLKHVVQYASFAAYHLSRETSFLVDEGASLPETPLRAPMVLPAKVVNVDTCISMTGNSEDPYMLEAVGEDDQGANSWWRFGGKHDFQCSDMSSGNAEVLSVCSGQEKLQVASDQKNSSIVADTEWSNSYFSADMRDHEGHQLELPDKEKTVLKTLENLESFEEKNSGILDRNEATQDFFSTSDSNQSILVSLSSSCMLKGTVCERPQLFRIKYYGNFDKPLGRFLRDDLFSQKSSCPSCKEPVEAHVRCYTHQHGCLSINVKRLSFMKLPGERDGKIWMWHRCLKCEYKDGVPPAAPRVIMSDAAWGLSFGKFLELSFSNHTTANRIASCGHSLQRDCLRFYGCGSMVAFFRYAPVNILSVHLPPSLMDFTCDGHEEWIKREENEISSKVGFLHSEVIDALYNLEQQIKTFECQPIRASIQNHISELNCLLKKERNDYNVMLQTTAIYDNIPVHLTQDILQLNRLRRSLLIDSYLWDRRLFLLNSFANSKSSSGKVDSQFLEISGHNKLKECGTRSFSEEGRPCNPLEDNFSKSLALEVSPRTILLSRQHDERNLQVLECKSNSVVEMDLSIESDESYSCQTVLSLVSGQHVSSDLRNGSSEAFCDASSFGRLPSPGCNLSEKIDLAWTGTGQTSKDPSIDGSVAVPVGSGSFLDSHRHRTVRVYSFDSGLRKIHGGLSPASARLFPVKSFDISGDFPRAAKETQNMQTIYAQRSVKEVKKFSAFKGHSPQYLSSMLRMISEGTRLLLPQPDHDDMVIAIYDDELTSVIAYAIHSQEYTDFITSKSDHLDGLNANEKGNIIQTPHQSPKQSRFEDPRSQSYGSHSGPHALPADILDQREPHFRSFFDDGPSFTTDKAKFSVTCYFARHFDALRKKSCPNEEDYIRSLSRCRRWNAQGGKSNVYFAKSWDDRFIVKQVTKTELESFLTFAPQYFKYLMHAINSRSPTCLAKVLGVYQVTAKNLKGGREVKMDLMVMENLFFRRNISRVYDLKGSLRARFNPDPSGENKVMLDLNLLETLRTKPIFLGSRAKRCLERAVWNDTSFLASVDVMDYSLLVGIDEERKELVIGIIDFIRQYTWDKHLETWVKTNACLAAQETQHQLLYLQCSTRRGLERQCRIIFSHSLINGLLELILILGFLYLPAVGSK